MMATAQPIHVPERRVAALLAGPVTDRPASPPAPASGEGTLDWPPRVTLRVTLVAHDRIADKARWVPPARDQHRSVGAGE